MFSRDTTSNGGSFEIQALLFDTDDVLYDATTWYRWVFRLLGHVGVHGDFTPFLACWQRDYLPQVWRGRQPFWGAFERYLEALGLRTGQIEEVLTAAVARHKAIERATRLFPGVALTLRQLANRDVPLGIVCNSSHRTAEMAQFLDWLHLSSCFRSMTVSADHACCLPESELFVNALTALGTAPQHTAFVSHDPIELAGAAKAGLIPVGYNLFSQTHTSPPWPVLDRFERLTEMIHPTRQHRRAG